jgi:multiple sugar transport system permease protein
MSSIELQTTQREALARAAKRRHQVNYFFKRVLSYISLSVLAFFFAIPFLWLVSTSLKSPEQIFILPPEWIPNPFAWSNYQKAVTAIPFFLYLKNTMYIALFNVVAVVFSSSLVAYGFSIVRWPGRDVLFMVVVATLMIPYAVLIIPTFIIFKNLGWINSPNPLTIPALTGSAFFIFLLRQFFMSIPEDLSDAARMDGANDWQIYWHIVMRLSRPALSVVALFTFMWNWNDFLGPLIYLGDKSQYTLAIGLYGFQGRSGTQWGPLMAAATIMITPIIALFFFTQKTFIQGITLTGIKG